MTPALESTAAGLTAAGYNKTENALKGNEDRDVGVPAPVRKVTDFFGDPTTSSGCPKRIQYLWNR
jgi:hypothetical protein